MKKLIVVACLLLTAGHAFAKKVKFSVNMSAEIVDTAGVHIAGDFQVLAGFAADWDPALTQMYQEVSDTNIYSVVVDIPAFQHYEFKFVNGDQGYQQEFVPLESRVNYNFLDNRWIYIDSLSNDTQQLAPIVFGGNAPAGKYLLRFYVDMQNVSPISPNGVHVAGDFQGWDPAITRMYSFDGSVYEYITYLDTGMNSTHYLYKFANGNTGSDYETVPGTCAVNGNRDTIAASHHMLATVCYSACVSCALAGIAENSDEALFTVSPNPSSGPVEVSLPANREGYHLQLVDVTGRLVTEQDSNGEEKIRIGSQELDGVYLLRISSTDAGTTKAVKRVVFHNGY